MNDDALLAAAEAPDKLTAELRAVLAVAFPGLSPLDRLALTRDVRHAAHVAVMSAASREPRQ